LSAGQPSTAQVVLVLVLDVLVELVEDVESLLVVVEVVLLLSVLLLFDDERESVL
jgi:hypothetical protein